VPRLEKKKWGDISERAAVLWINNPKRARVAKQTNLGSISESFGTPETWPTGWSPELGEKNQVFSSFESQGDLQAELKRLQTVARGGPLALITISMKRSMCQKTGCPSYDPRGTPVSQSLIVSVSGMAARIAAATLCARISFCLSLVFFHKRGEIRSTRITWSSRTAWQLVSKIDPCC